MKIDEKMINEYKMFLKLRDKMSRVYRYRLRATIGSEWKEGTDKLADICYKLTESWITDAELIEEVKL